MQQDTVVMTKQQREGITEEAAIEGKAKDSRRAPFPQGVSRWTLDFHIHKSGLSPPPPPHPPTHLFPVCESWRS